MCKDFPWGDQFAEHQYSEEEKLALNREIRRFK